MGERCFPADEARARLRASLADHEIGEMACLGRCHRGGAFQLDGDQFDGADIDGEVPHGDAIPFHPAAGESVFVPLSTDPLDDYRAALLAPAEILAELNASRLCGRGGAGFLLGHASVVAIPASFPMRDFLAHLFEFASHESCGKCFPCRLGTRRGFEQLRDASAGRPIDAAAFGDLLETLELGSLCALGGGLPLPVRNVLAHFADEVRPLFHGEMPA